MFIEKDLLVFEIVQNQIPFCYVFDAALMHDLSV